MSLPSSSPEILTEFVTSFGVLQTRALLNGQGFALVLTADGKETEIASHANGFSCHALSERMARRDSLSVAEQAEFIVRCGGTALPTKDILALMSVCTPCK
jgi:hypothetical protein